MNNQAAQTMPERTYMTRDDALKIARACAYAKCHTHGYLPRTAQEAADWQPHEWALDAIRWNALSQPAGVAEPVFAGYDPGEDDREAEDYHVIMTMGRLLAAIAISVRGPEPAGTAWSYHDLPDIVAALQEAAEQVADEMTAWAAAKMADRGSSRRDRLMIREWAKRLRNPETFPVKDFEVEGTTLTKEEMRAIVRKVIAAPPAPQGQSSNPSGLSSESAALSSEQRLAQGEDWQQRCLDLGFVYGRAPDDHWVECTQEQAAALLRDVLGVDARFIESPVIQSKAEEWQPTPCPTCGGFCGDEGKTCAEQAAEEAANEVHQYRLRADASGAWYDEGTGPTPDAWHHDCVVPDHVWRTTYKTKVERDHD